MCKGMGFGVNTNIYDRMPKVAKLNLNTTRQIEQEWLGEAYLKIMDGTSNTETAGLSVYAANSERFAALERAKKGDIAMLDSTETMLGYEGIQADFVTDTKAIKAFEEVEANADMQFYLDSFKSMRANIYIEEGKDIWYLLNLSLQDKKEAHSKIRALSEDYPYLKEVITFVIKNPACYSALYNTFKDCVILAS